MKIEQLFYLEDIAKTHSISQTAEKFFITAPAVNTQIKKLEEEFNITLLERSNQGVILTPQGYDFLQKTEIIRDTYRQLRNPNNASVPKDLYHIQATDLRILANNRLFDLLVSNFLIKYIEKYPHINFTVSEKADFAIIEQIHQKKADFGLILIPDKYLEYLKKKHDWISELEFSMLYSDCYVICCHKNHPIASFSEITPHDMWNNPMIYFVEDEHLFDFYHFSEYPTGSIMYTSNLNFHIKMLRNTNAVTSITNLEYFKIYHAYKDLIMLPAPFAPQYNIMLVSRPYEELNDISRFFVEELKKIDFYS